MWDVYLGGLAENDWRENFKSKIGTDVGIFDPMVDGFDRYDDSERANQTAREFTHMQDQCALVVFYFKKNWLGINSLLQLGDSVGRGKQVFVCIDGSNGKPETLDEEKIRNYCDYTGAPVLTSLNDLVMTVEEYLAELEMCGEDMAG